MANAITLKAIDKKIDTFITNRDKLRALAVEVTVDILYHCAPDGASPDCQGSGDCTRYLKLSKALPKSWAAQLEAWLKAFTPIRLITKNDKCEFDPKYKAIKGDPAAKLTWWKVAEAVETNFFDFSDEPEVETKVLDFDGLVAMVKRLSGQIDKKLEKGEIRESDRESARSISAQIAGLRFTPVKQLGADNAVPGADAPLAPVTKPSAAE